MHEVIDIDDYERTVTADSVLRERLEGRTSTMKSMCEGYPLQFPSGTAHTGYPFALHRTLSLPWDYAVHSGVMVLHAQSCTKFLDQGNPSCQNCRELLKETRLQGIHTRLDEGINEYSPLPIMDSMDYMISYTARSNSTNCVTSTAHTIGGELRSPNTSVLPLLLPVGKLRGWTVDRIVRVGLSQKKGFWGSNVNVGGRGHGHVSSTELD